MELFIQTSTQIKLGPFEKKAQVGACTETKRNMIAELRVYASYSIVWDKWEELHGLSKQVADQRDWCIKRLEREPGC